jgi:methylenetetrahydrofolate dehydrogenase (NADP+)/methenyltetrahydrofolate cyclohydrolase
MILDGKKVSLKIQEEIKKEVSSFTKRKPGLAVVLVGSHPASQTYVKMKRKACENVGINPILIELPDNVSQSCLIKAVEKLNQDVNVDGILIQLPLPSHIDETAVIQSINPSKDVDCFHPLNVGKMTLGQSVFIPCTPGGILLLLNEYNITIEGKHVVILGRSNLVGKPLALLLMQKNKNANATVTVLHSKSSNSAEICKSADILVAAIGSPKFVKENFVKEGCIVIDVGINRVENHITGDVDFDIVSDKCSFITPVPGGCGPMTIVMLLKNTLIAYSLQHIN